MMPLSDNKKTAPPLSALILSAGYSSRMGAFKPLLSVGHHCFLAQAVTLFRRAGIADVRAVIGHQAEALKPLLEELQVPAIYNSGYSKGMFSSVRAGIGQLPKACHGFFILPVDIPLVRPHTVSRLVREFVRGRGKILYPVFAGNPGHPPLISGEYIPEILDWHGDGGLRGFLAQKGEQAATIEVGDGAILMDADTPAGYERLLKKYRHRHIPDPGECEALMTRVFQVAPWIWAHCQKVAEVSLEIADALIRSGYRLNRDRIQAAALLHDLARGEKAHAQKGAAILAEMGYFEIAEIVAAHMDLGFDGVPAIHEKAVVYLADKRVAGDRRVDLIQRFQSKMDLYQDDPEALAAIQGKLDRALAVQARVVAATGRGSF